MRILFLDCFSGIAGDMFIGAMVDAGLEFDVLQSELAKLNLKGYSLAKRNVVKSGIRATKIDVPLEDENQHSHRKYVDIVEIIKNSSLSSEIKKDSIGVFHVLAEAEAKIHGKIISEVEFHEVGGLDSIVDIVGSAIAVNLLKISEVYSSPLNVGSGKGVFHGEEFDIPAPATRAILKEIPTYSIGQGELVTPTGASIVRHYCKSWMKPVMEIDKEGFGAGDRDFENPNVLHVILGER